MKTSIESLANGLILRIEDGEATGVGEATPLAGRSNETLDEAEAALREWSSKSSLPPQAPPPSGRGTGGGGSRDAVPYARTAEAEAALACASTITVPSARFAAETALLDLLAARHRCSIAELFGPTCPIETNALVAIDAESVSARTVKVKVGRDPDLAALRRLRARLPETAIRIDANAAWSLDEARRHLAALVEIAPEYVEQPVPDLFALASSPVPIAADEQAASLPPVASVVVLKPMVLGGFAACRAIAEQARALGKDVVVTHSADGPVALAAAREVARILRCTRACGVERHAGLRAWPSLSLSSEAVARTASPGPLPEGGGIAPSELPEKRGTGIARSRSAEIALIAGERRWTFAEVEGEIARIAAPEVSSIVAHPVPETVFAILAALSQGRWIAPLHPRLPESERAARAAALPSRAPMPGAGIIVSTSGSTGRPKAALLPARCWEASAEASAKVLPLSPDDRWLLAMPLAHVGGISIVIRSWLARSTVVLAERFDPAGLNGITLVSLVPAQLARWLESGVAPPRSLRAVLLGGAAASPALLARAKDAGIRVLATYGLTEACSQVATQREPALEGCGAPLPDMQVRVVSDRIQVRGPAIFAGYLGEPSPFLEGAWLDTGDLGRIEEGTLHVLGRADDRITTGGEKVDPLQVERVLEECPGVRTAVVFGVEDATWGQIVCAAWEGDAGEETIAAFSRERLAAFQRPRRLVKVDALPVGSSGKLDRRRAAALARERM